MFKTILTFAAVAALAATVSLPAHAFLTGNALAENGLGTNALAENGLGTNALGGNGISTNALNPNGGGLNALGGNGRASGGSGFSIDSVELPAATR